MNGEKKSIVQQISDGELSISIRPPDEYIQSLVFQAMVPVQKKYMQSALKAFCLSCEHCDYCAVKANTTKCKRFHSFLSSYLENIKDTVL